MPYSPMQKHCLTMKDHKGKTTGIMMEGSAMHMSMLHKETDKQEKKDLLKDMPIDDKASAIEMSPYKMGHKSPAEMGHKDSPAEFTGMSGGSALHQDADLSDIANSLFGTKKLSKAQAEKIKKQVEGNPMAKDTLPKNAPKKEPTQTFSGFGQVDAPQNTNQENIKNLVRSGGMKKG